MEKQKDKMWGALVESEQDLRGPFRRLAVREMFRVTDCFGLSISALSWKLIRTPQAFVFVINVRWSELKLNHI